MARCVQLKGESCIDRTDVPELTGDRWTKLLTMLMCRKSIGCIAAASATTNARVVNVFVLRGTTSELEVEKHEKRLTTVMTAFETTGSLTSILPDALQVCPVLSI